MYLCEYGVVELRPWRRQGGLVRGAGVAAEGAAVPLHDPGGHRALSVQVGRQSVPVLQADLEDLNFFDFGDQQQVVQGLDIADSFNKINKIEAGLLFLILYQFQINYPCTDTAMHWKIAKK